MKVVYLDKNNKKMIISLDYLEAEILGYDVIKKKDVSGNYFHDVLRMIRREVNCVFGESFDFGVKTYVDDTNGMFYFEIKPYADRLDEFVMEEMIKKNYCITFLFPDGI